jgi:menaquinone-dependent protoporphyrinogen oxidase
MGILLAFSTRHGTTRKVGTILADRLKEHEVSLCNLMETPLPDLKPYEGVILGGSIHAGFIQTEVRRLLESRKELLLTKKVGLYLCYMDKARAANNFAKAFPEEIREHAVAKGLFGGELIFEKMSWLDKLIVGRFTHYRETVSELRMEEIDRFADDMRRALTLSSKAAG